MSEGRAFDNYSDFDKKLYRTWLNFRNRCNNPNNKKYHRYGGRGITVAEEWNTFEQFRTDMGGLYESGLTLDRIDNNQGYNKANCRWATSQQQANNKGNNRKLCFRGRCLNIATWAKSLNIKRSTLSMRFYKYNWSIEKCLTTSVMERKYGIK